MGQELSYVVILMTTINGVLYLGLAYWPGSLARIREYIYPKSEFNYYDQIPVNPFKKIPYFSRLNSQHARSIFGRLLQNNFH